MPKRSRITETEKVEILRYLSEGKTPSEIGKIVGRDRTTISKIRDGKGGKNVTTGGKIIHIRVSDEEYAAFKSQIAARKLTASEAGRRLVRSALGVLDLSREEIGALHTLRKELNAIGINLNQMTQLGNSGRLKWNERDAKLMVKLDERVDDLVNDLVALCSVARKKTMADAALLIGGGDSGGGGKVGGDDGA